MRTEISLPDGIPGTNTPARNMPSIALSEKLPSEPVCARVPIFSIGEYAYTSAPPIPRPDPLTTCPVTVLSATLILNVAVAIVTAHAEGQPETSMSSGWGIIQFGGVGGPAKKKLKPLGIAGPTPTNQRPFWLR